MKLSRGITANDEFLSRICGLDDFRDDLRDRLELLDECLLE